MIEENKFKPVDSISLYNDDIGKVTLYDASHSNESEEQRIWTVTTAASLAYGNEEAKKPEELYKRMQSIKHESLWELIRWTPKSGSFDIQNSMRNTTNSYGNYYPFNDIEDTITHKENIACFRIKVPLFVARQFMRHRAFSYLEMSRRYTKDSKSSFEFWFPEDFHQEFSSRKKVIYLDEYNSVIDNGYHTQVASRFLPQTTYTEFYVMGEIEGLKNFFTLRLDPHAQDEILESAEAMLELLRLYQPELYSKVV